MNKKTTKKGKFIVIEALYSGEPDYITPLVVRENPELKSLYDEAMEKIFAGVTRAIESGIPKEWALMLLAKCGVMTHAGILGDSGKNEVAS